MRSAGCSASSRTDRSAPVAPTTSSSPAPSSASGLGMAEAILTLDNGDGWLPIDFAEVSIGRRAYRSGEGEYLINGARARLRDVVELLGEGRLGANELVVVGQGTVDAALSLRPEERRQLFEEAAGVKGLQVRRNEASVRLGEVARQPHPGQRPRSRELKPQVRRLALQAEHQQQHDALGARARALVVGVAPTPRAGGPRVARGGAPRARPPPRRHWTRSARRRTPGARQSRPRRSATGPAEEAAREAGHAREATREAVIRAEGRLEALDGRLRELVAALERESAELAEAQRELDSTRRRGRRGGRAGDPAGERGRGGVARRRRRARGGGRGPARRRGGRGRAARAGERPDRRRRARVRGGRATHGPIRRGRAPSTTRQRAAADEAASAPRPRPRCRAERTRGPCDGRERRPGRAPRRSAMRPRRRPTPRGRPSWRSPSGSARSAPSWRRPRSRTMPRRASGGGWPRPAGRACSTRSTPPRTPGPRSRRSSAASWRARCSGPDDDPRGELGGARGAARLLGGHVRERRRRPAHGARRGRCRTDPCRLDRRRRRGAARVPTDRRRARRRRAARRLAAACRRAGAPSPPRGTWRMRRGVIVLRGRADPPGGASARAHARRRELASAVGRMEDEAAFGRRPDAHAATERLRARPGRAPRRARGRRRRGRAPCVAFVPMPTRPRRRCRGWPSGSRQLEAELGQEPVARRRTSSRVTLGRLAELQEVADRARAERDERARRRDAAREAWNATRGEAEGLETRVVEPPPAAIGMREARVAQLSAALPDRRADVERLDGGARGPRRGGHDGTRRGSPRRRRHRSARRRSGPPDAPSCSSWRATRAAEAPGSGSSSARRRPPPSRRHAGTRRWPRWRASASWRSRASRRRRPRRRATRSRRSTTRRSRRRCDACGGPSPRSARSTRSPWRSTARSPRGSRR